MSGQVSFTLVSPERLVLSTSVDMVVMPGETGDFGVLPNHAALVSHLRPGLIHIHKGDVVTQQIFISGGFANVNERGCTVMAEDCIFLDDLKKQDLNSHLNEMQIDLELARTEEEEQYLRRTMNITRAKMEILKSLEVE